MLNQQIFNIQVFHWFMMLLIFCIWCTMKPQPATLPRYTNRMIMIETYSNRNYFTGTKRNFGNIFWFGQNCSVSVQVPGVAGNIVKVDRHIEIVLVMYHDVIQVEGHDGHEQQVAHVLQQMNWRSNPWIDFSPCSSRRLVENFPQPQQITVR